MKNSSLWEISVVYSPEAEDAIVELLTRIFNQPAAIYYNEKTKITRVSIYCNKLSDWTDARRKLLADGLLNIKSSGLNIGTTRIRVRAVAREDWSESWKRHFKPIEIGKRLLIKPSWIKQRPKKNQAVVVLDPGLSFGTGNHPTTFFCLHQLEADRKTITAQSFLDIGTGSGILAIAAAKLGYAPVRAFDFDPEAVRVAKENACQNDVLKQIELSQQDITKFQARAAQKYDFVCANLISNLLIAEKRRIINCLSPNGTLVLAGILRKEFSLVQKAYEEAGLKLTSSRSDREWRSGAFTFATPAKRVRAR